MDFKKGDKVSFLDSTETGVILEFLDINRIKIEDKDGFIKYVNPKKLVKIEKKIYNNLKFNEYLEEENIYKKKSKKNIKQ